MYVQSTKYTWLSIWFRVNKTWISYFTGRQKTLGDTTIMDKVTKAKITGGYNGNYLQD